MLLETWDIKHVTGGGVLSPAAVLIILGTNKVPVLFDQSEAHLNIYDLIEDMER